MPRRPKLARGLYWHPKTGIIWTRFWVRGEECRRSCSTRDPRQAEVEGRRLRVEAEQDSSVGRSRGGTSSIEDLAVDDILEHRRRGINELFVDRLESQWAVTLRNLPAGVAASEITYDALRAYEGKRRVGVRATVTGKDGKPRDRWIDRPARGQTIVRELRCIRRALLIAKRRGAIRELPDPWPTIRRDPADKRRSGKLWPPELVVAFLRKLHDDARDEVEFAVLTGLRLFEVKRVEAGWVEPAPQGAATPALLRVPAWAAKTREERVLGLPAPAVAIIKRRVEDEPRRAQVFSGSNFRKHRATAATALGWPAPPTMRDLRHTYATLALLGTSDPVATMRSLGHKDLRTTERYLSSTLERIAAASAAVETALVRGAQPDHQDRITVPASEENMELSTGNHLERAKRLELSTLSLGSGAPGSNWLQSLATEIAEERARTALDVVEPDHHTGSPAKRRGGGAA